MAAFTSPPPRGEGLGVGGQSDLRTFRISGVRLDKESGHAPTYELLTEATGLKTVQSPQYTRNPTRPDQSDPKFGQNR